MGMFLTMPEVCRVCGVKLTAENWMPSSQRKGHRICTPCHGRMGAAWRKRHPDQHFAIRSKYVDRVKLDVLSHYSNGRKPVCAGCGFVDVRALTIDHIHNDARSQMKRGIIPYGHGFYQYLRREGYPPGYQVLCANCQLIKELARRRSRDERILPGE